MPAIGALLVFGPIILFFGFFFLLVIGFLFLIFKLVMKGKKSAWKGTLVDKQHNTKDVDDDGHHKTEHYYSLIFQTEDNKRIPIAVAKEAYDKWSPGDKAEKVEGEFWPKKI